MFKIFVFSRERVKTMDQTLAVEVSNQFTMLIRTHPRWRTRLSPQYDTSVCLPASHPLLLSPSRSQLGGVKVFFPFPEQSELSGSEHGHRSHRYAAHVQTSDPSLWGHEFQCLFTPPSLANMPALNPHSSFTDLWEAFKEEVNKPGVNMHGLKFEGFCVFSPNFKN